jgi:tetratricopeptide (TPR) repeat protein
MFPGGWVCAQAGPAKGSGDPQDRIESVNKLLTVSSAARKIESSGNPRAQKMLAEARRLRGDAKKSLASGDREEAAKLLDGAIKSLMEAARLADGGAAVTEKKKDDYTERKESIEALLETYQRIAAEKGARASAASVQADVLSLMGRAEKQYRQEDYAGGRATLDRAYEELKVSLEKLRGGETLVNALNFATKKDEYAYYVGKVTSQRTAIGVFSQRLDNPGKRTMIDSILKQADEAQARAEGLAKRGDYAAAVPVMDKVLKRLQSGLMMVAYCLAEIALAATRSGP